MFKGNSDCVKDALFKGNFSQNTSLNKGLSFLKCVDISRLDKTE